MLKFKITIIIFLLLTALRPACAFDDHDFQVWHTEEQEKTIADNFKITLQEEARLGDNGGNLYYQHYDAGVLYLANKNLDLGLYYRQIINKKDGKFRQQNYPHINATLKAEFFGFSLQDRNWFGYSFVEKGTDYWRYRNKFTLKFPWEISRFKIRPFLADEIFINMDKGVLDRNRFYAGLGMNFMDNLSGEIYYLLQSSKSSGKWKDYNVLGTKIKLSF